MDYFKSGATQTSNSISRTCTLQWMLDHSGFNAFVNHRSSSKNPGAGTNLQYVATVSGTSIGLTKDQYNGYQKVMKQAINEINKLNGSNGDLINISDHTERALAELKIAESVYQKLLANGDPHVKALSNLNIQSAALASLVDSNFYTSENNGPIIRLATDILSSHSDNLRLFDGLDKKMTNVDEIAKAAKACVGGSEKTGSAKAKCDDTVDFISQRKPAKQTMHPR